MSGLPGKPAAWLGVLAGLVLLLTVWVSVTGPTAVLGAAHLPPAPKLPPGLRQSPHGGQKRPPKPPKQVPLHALNIVITAGIVCLAALAIALLTFIVYALWRRARRRRRARLELTAPDEFADVLLSLPDALQQATERASELVRTAGEPRNAIVACWLTLEEAAAAAGTPRHPSETSTEYTARVLNAFSVDPDAVAALAALYREARFSRHGLSEADRAAALAAVARIGRVGHHRLTSVGGSVPTSQTAGDPSDA